MATETATPARGELVRQEFGGSSIQASGETAMTASAATARALVEARFVMAMQRPRDWNDVRVRILKAIERPGFAGKHGEKSKPGEAWFRKPVGSGIEGLSIRFAEEALRCMGNIDVRPLVTYEDDEKRLIDVSVLDLESNLSFTSTVVVPKTIERKSLRRGEQAIRSRVNSQGEVVYLRAATDDEIATTQGALVSKMIRTEALRILPGDIQAAATQRILEIRFGDAASDPDKVQREIADAFAKLNVSPASLRDYLGHELAACSPAELAHLRELYKAIKGGETTWADTVKAAQAESEAGGDAKPAEKKPGLQGLTERLQNGKAEPAEAREPGSDDGDDAPSAAAPSNCEHPSVPPSKVAATPKGKSVVCSDCGEAIPGEAEGGGRRQGRLVE